MMRTLAIGVLAVSLAAGSSGCSRSPRVTFYTLEPVPRSLAAPSAAVVSPSAASPVQGAVATSAPAAAATQGAAPGAAPAAATGVRRIAVGPVTLPELVDRPQLVVRVAANRVDILEMQRWAEPLKNGVARVVAADLGRLLPSAQVSSYLEQAGSGAEYRVLLDIVRLEAAAGEGVSLEAAWALRGPSAGAAKTGRFVVRETAGEGYDALVAAYGRALSALSAELAQVLGAEPAARP